MRPNIDISWDLHGEIKEYSNKIDQNIEDAYKDLLRRGLKKQPDRSGSFQTDNGGEVVFSRLDENVGVGDVILFSQFSGGFYDDPTVIRTEEQNIEIEDAEGILHELSRRFGTTDGSFSIHQKNAGWYGDGGVDQFAYWLDNLNELYRNTPKDLQVDQHRTASAAYLGGAGYPAGNVLIYATPDGHGTLEQFGIEFLIDGYPLTGGEFQEFADTAGLSLSHIKRWDDYDYDRPESYHRVGVSEDGPVVLEEKRYQSEEEHVLEGVVCRNPFYQNESAAEREFKDSWQSQLMTGIEQLPGRLRHTVDEDMDFELFISRFMVTNLILVSKAPFTIFNVNFEVNW